MTVEVKKDELINRLKLNRQEHKRLYAEASQAYVRKALEALEEKLVALQAGEDIDLTVRLMKPVDYSESYDDAIARMEWEQRGVIPLSDEEFKQLVQNKWHWQGAWAQNSLSYLNQ